MKNRIIGIVAATENEIAPFVNQLTDVQISNHAMLQFHAGKYFDIDIVALYCGVCKVNAAIAAQILIGRYGVSELIMIGVAGAIDAGLNIFDTVVSDEITYHDVAPEILTEYHPRMKHPHFMADRGLLDGIILANTGDATVFPGKIATGEAFIDQEGREEIIKAHSPLCVDMETASVAHVCYVNDIPFVAIRSISDTPRESGNDAFAKYVRCAAKKSVQVLNNYLNSIIGSVQ